MQLPCSRAAREARADPWVCRLKEKDSYTVIFVLKIRGAHIINSSSGYLTCGIWGDPPDRGQGSSESGVDQTPAAREARREGRDPSARDARAAREGRNGGKPPLPPPLKCY